MFGGKFHVQTKIRDTFHLKMCIKLFFYIVKLYILQLDVIACIHSVTTKKSGLFPSIYFLD